VLKLSGLKINKLVFMLFLFIASLLIGCANNTSLITVARQDSCFSTKWPHEESDMLPDPAIIFGRLPNGMRYVIMKNNEPKERVGLYLDVQAGSLQEKDGRQGSAHFLEHMLFNGTTHFPPGTLVEYFQSIGMSFGADSNAHTSYDETVYNLFLPDGGRENLDKGLLVMRDYARGALLTETEVNSERKVILAEKRERDSAGYRVQEKQTEFLFAGTKAAKRVVIGKEEDINAATSKTLRDYYDFWYHPENMILVLVGDFDAELTKELIAKHFGSLQGKEFSAECLDFGDVKHKGTEVFYLNEPDLGYTEVSIESAWNILPQADTIAWERERLVDYLAVLMMNYRLQKIVNMPDSPFTSASMYNGIFLNHVEYASLSADTESDGWEQAMILLHKTLRQALEGGFFPSELAQAKKEIIGDLDKNVQTANSRNTRELAQQIIYKLNNDEVILSPLQEQNLYTPMLNDMKLKEVNESFRRLWRHNNKVVQVVGTSVPQSENGKPESKIKEVFDNSEKIAIKPYEKNAKPVFPYLSLPTGQPGSYKAEELKDIDAEKVVLENGTVVNLKKTAFKPNEVVVNVRFGQGYLSEPAAGLGLLAQEVVSESGFGRLTVTELSEVLAGRNADISFDVSDESFSFHGSCLKDEMELLFQLIYTGLLDPAFRQEAYQLAMERMQQMYESMQSSVEGMMQLEGEGFLAGGNMRYSMPAWKDFKQLSLSQVEEWLRPVFSNAQLELSIVGDIDINQTRELANRYFGLLDRKPAISHSGEKIVFPSGEHLDKSVDTEINKAFLVVAWPTDDFWEISRTRRLGVLAEVLDDRLRLEIREKMGGTYSPVVYNDPSRVDPGYGVLRVQLTGDPALVKELIAGIDRTAAELAASGLKPGELTRIVGPIQTSIKDMMRTNRYWLDSVLTLSSRHPQQLMWPLTLKDDFASITKEEIDALAKRYLQKGNETKIIILPNLTEKDN